VVENEVGSQVQDSEEVGEEVNQQQNIIEEGSLSVQEGGFLEVNGSGAVSVPVEGLNLEVVLTAGIPTPASGIQLLLGNDQGQTSLPMRLSQDNEALKLLQIQKEVGFVYEEADDVVLNVMQEDELRDNKKKEEWEQSDCF
jgi:hypothetical protein